MAKNPTYREQLRAIKNSPLKPVYIITGAEEYLRETAITLIIKKGSSNGDEAVTVTKLFGDEVDADTLSVNLATYSLFTEKKFVIIKDAGKMNGECWANIERYAKEPSEIATLILEDEKLDKRNSSIKSILKNGAHYDFPLLYDNQLMGWLRWYAEKSGVALSNDAVQVLKDSTEPLLRNYVNEFEKIQLFAQQKKKLTADDITAVVHASRSFNIFDFTHALCEPDSSQVLKLLQQVFLYNESAPGIIVMIARHLTILLKIKLNSDKGLDRNTIARLAGITPFRYNQYAQQAERISVEEIQNLLEDTLEGDAHLKTGYQNDKMVLTVLVQKFKTAFNMTGQIQRK